jgi:hypothetical protein
MFVSAVLHPVDMLLEEMADLPQVDKFCPECALALAPERRAHFGGEPPAPPHPYSLSSIHPEHA